MIEEIFYLDEGQLKITAASVGISSRRWTSIKDSEIKNENFKKIMNDNRFDILPIVSADETTSKFLKTDIPNNYDTISTQTITYRDVLPLDTSIREVIKGFVTENRTFYFLTYHSRITGLITLGNLNCRQVQVYIFGLICDLERKLGEFIEENSKKEDIKNWVETNQKLKKIWKEYQKLLGADLENKLIEHLYLSNLFTIILDFELYPKLDYDKEQWIDLRNINKLRNLVAHPTRSLLNKENDIEILWKRIGEIEDLTFRLNQIKSVSSSTPNYA
jgi:hypothetical protein